VTRRPGRAPLPGRLGPAERVSALTSMQAEEVDVLVVGGGVVGAGVALDAATRGLSVALVHHGKVKRINLPDRWI